MTDPIGVATSRLFWIKDAESFPEYMAKLGVEVTIHDAADFAKPETGYPNPALVSLRADDGFWPHVLPNGEPDEEGDPEADDANFYNSLATFVLPGDRAVLEHVSIMGRRSLNMEVVVVHGGVAEGEETFTFLDNDDIVVEALTPYEREGEVVYQSHNLMRGD